MKEHFYHVEIKWDSERKGLMCSSEINGQVKDGHGCIEVATPPEFPKGIAGIWSPEHLFTASVVSCFMTTFLAIAENSKLAFSTFSCKAAGKLEEMDGKFLMTEVILHPDVSIQDEKQRDRALRVLQRSEGACLITNSIKSKVTLNPVVSVNLYQ